MKRLLLTGAWESYNYLAGLASEGALTATQADIEELEANWDKCLAALNQKNLAAKVRSSLIYILFCLMLSVGYC